MRTMRRAIIGNTLCLLTAVLVVLTAAILSTAGRPAFAEESGVCAKVRIKLNQEIALTRTAFRATLEVMNAPENVTLTNVMVTLDIKNEAGDDSISLFGIRPPELTAISDVNGTGTIAPGTTATAVWTIIPTRDAAPEAPTRYLVGGTLSYNQDGQTVNQPLWPAPIMVKPDPLLTLDYFWVRDVYADDARTPEIEPSELFPLGLIVRNDGKGAAHNMRITSSQPEIIENEKGLLITFKILSTQINSGEVAPTLNANLGDIPPGGTSVVRWMMSSTLAGTFSEYSATFEHVDDLGDPRLSLIDSVNIHELNHSVRVDIPSDDNKPDFLVNSAETHLPSSLFDSTGFTLPVTSVTDGVITGSLGFGNYTLQLNANAPEGWAYFQAEDLGQEMFVLKRVVRSDGREIIMGDNAWTTHRTTCPVGESCHRIHKVNIFDKDSTGVYTLIYEPKAAPATASVQQAKGLRDGEWVELGCGEGLVVTAVFPECFYVERSDRVCGIRVSRSGSVSPGMRVSITGQVGTTPGLERYIQATSVQTCGSELAPVAPVAMNPRSVGGAGFLFDPTTGIGQHPTQAYRGMPGSGGWERSEFPLNIPGLSNVGLLITTWGKVAWVDAATSTFYLDDGSGYDEFRFPNVADNMPPGLRVTMPVIGMQVPPVGSTVTVTGVSSCFTSGANVYRVLRARSEEDVTAR